MMIRIRAFKCLCLPLGTLLLVILVQYHHMARKSSPIIFHDKITTWSHELPSGKLSWLSCLIQNFWRRRRRGNLQDPQHQGHYEDASFAAGGLGLARTGDRTARLPYNFDETEASTLHQKSRRAVTQKASRIVSVPSQTTKSAHYRSNYLERSAKDNNDAPFVLPKYIASNTPIQRPSVISNGRRILSWVAAPSPAAEYEIAANLPLSPASTDKSDNNVQSRLLTNPPGGSLPPHAALSVFVTMPPVLIQPQASPPSPGWPFFLSHQTPVQNGAGPPTAVPSLISVPPTSIPTLVPTVPSIPPSLSSAPSLSTSPSLMPTSSSAPTVSDMPSLVPSSSSEPSLAPSVSMAPSVSVAPSVGPTISMVPSSSHAPSGSSSGNSTSHPVVSPSAPIPTPSVPTPTAPQPVPVPVRSPQRPVAAPVPVAAPMAAPVPVRTPTAPVPGPRPTPVRPTNPRTKKPTRKPTQAPTKEPTFFTRPIFDRPIFQATRRPAPTPCKKNCPTRRPTFFRRTRNPSATLRPVFGILGESIQALTSTMGQQKSNTENNDYYPYPLTDDPVPPETNGGGNS